MAEIIKLFLFTILGILLIGKGSDWFTDSLIPVARRLGVSRVSVGLILVSSAVSLPEILVAVYGALKGYPEIGLGVVLGSIIANIGLMIGLSSLIQPLKVTRHVIFRDGIFSLIIPILVFAVAHGGTISRFEGVVFFLLFIPYVINVLLQERSLGAAAPHMLREIEFELKLLGFEFGKIKSPWIAFCFGLTALLLGAQLFSSQLITLVNSFGLSEIFVGVTLGAIGPSLPNILTAIQATRKGMGDIAVSETLGSNIFTLLVTLGILAIVAPIKLTDRWLAFDLPVVNLMSFLLFFFMVTKQTISKKEGVFLLGCYVLSLLVQGLFA